MKEGVRRLSAALQEDHYGVERDLRRCFTLRVSACTRTHTHGVSFSFSADANALTHAAAPQHSNGTNTFTFNFHSESFSERRLNPAGKQSSFLTCLHASASHSHVRLLTAFQ